MSIFISVEELAGLLGAPGLSIIDGSWYLPAQNRNAGAEYRQGHIPGAVRFDLDAIADHSTGLPHMLPSEAEFSAAVGALGIGTDDLIVVYDGLGLFSAPRVRWTFRYFGAANVKILEGGLPAWLASGKPVTASEETPAPKVFVARANKAAVRTYQDMTRHTANQDAQVLDARSAGRFAGSEPEPRPGLSSGHMKGAISLPFGEVVAGGRLKAPGELDAVLASRGIDIQKPIITSCGSGVTAAVIALALESVGASNVALYDGSWAEWASTPGSEIIKDI